MKKLVKILPIQWCGFRCKLERDWTPDTDKEQTRLSKKCHLF